MVINIDGQTENYWMDGQLDRSKSMFFVHIGPLSKHKKVVIHY